MKTKVLSIVAMLAATAAFAQTNQVLSKNAVGYVQVTIPPAGSYNLSSFNFNAIGGTNATLMQVFGGQLAEGPTLSTSERILIYDPIALSYQTFWIRNTDHLFRNQSSAITNRDLPVGTAFWLQSPGAATTNHSLYLMGEVPAQSNVIVSIIGAVPALYQQIANPYPTAIDVNQLINTNNGAIGGVTATTSDKLLVWSTVTTNYINLALRAADGLWHSVSSFNGAAPTVIMSPGQGAWYQARTNFTWVATKPYTWP